MDEKRAKNHVNLVAGLHIGFGALGIFGALIVFLGLKFAWGFIPYDEDIPREIFTALMTFIPGIIAFFGLIDIIAGFSLFSYKQWSRTLMIIISAINCLNIPIGTAKGVYSIWALMQSEVMELFE